MPDQTLVGCFFSDPNRGRRDEPTRGLATGRRGSEPGQGEQGIGPRLLRAGAQVGRPLDGAHDTHRDRSEPVGDDRFVSLACAEPRNQSLECALASGCRAAAPLHICDELVGGALNRSDRSDLNQLDPPDSGLDESWGALDGCARRRALCAQTSKTSPFSDPQPIKESTRTVMPAPFVPGRAPTRSARSEDWGAAAWGFSPRRPDGLARGCRAEPGFSERAAKREGAGGDARANSTCPAARGPYGLRTRLSVRPPQPRTCDASVVASTSPSPLNRPFATTFNYARHRAVSA